MHTKLATATLIAAFVLGALAAPATKGPRQARLKQIEGRKVFKSGSLQLAQAYEKYGQRPPADVLKGVARSNNQKITSSVAANPELYDRTYTTPVYIGNSNNSLTLTFDTGSSDLWVFSSQQPQYQTAGHTVYNLTGQLSSGESWNVTYQDGSSAYGNVWVDKVTIGDIALSGQLVEAAINATTEFTEDSDRDGLLGLSYSIDNTCMPNKCGTYFTNIASYLTKPIFTAALGYQQPGTYTFGYVDTSLYTGPLSYVPLKTTGYGIYYYLVKAGSYAAGSSSNVLGSLGNAVIDTGTTLLLLPAGAVSKYYSNVDGAEYSQDYGAFVYPCSTTPPDFYVQLGKNFYDVPGYRITYAPVDSTNTTCFGGIQYNGGLPFSVFGDIFLSSVYVVFSPQTKPPKLGFAAQP